MGDDSAAAVTVVEGTALTRRFGTTTALDGATFTAVSYTHLTLPTIYSV